MNSLVSTPIALLEPDAEGRVSGGFLYNRLFSQHCPEVTRISIPNTSLPSTLGRLNLSKDTLLVADSLFLEPLAFDALLTFKRVNGHPGFAFLLHALPSFLQRASSPERNAAPDAWLPTPSERHMLEQTDWVLAPGPYIPKLLSDAGIRLPALTCFPGKPNASACQLASPEPNTGTSERPWRLISLGAVTLNKGHLDALTALAGLRNLAFSWTILGDQQGDPRFVAELKRQVRACGLERHVNFVQTLPHAQALEVLARADVLLLPSYTENQPLAVMEALHFGVPVVGYDVGGVADIVGAVGAARLVRRGDVVALTQQLFHLLNQPAAYPSARADCLRVAQQWPSWQESADAFRAQLATLLTCVR